VFQHQYVKTMYYTTIYKRMVLKFHTSFGYIKPDDLKHVAY